jgi:hemolysin activation/secretion protein
LQINYARRLGENTEFRARVAGQIASGLLYTAERLSAGGENTVRGYRENLLLADEGAIASAEIVRRVAIGPRRAAGRFDWGALSASVFVDGAALHNRGGIQSEPQNIASAGVGASWTPSPSVNARIAYGVPFIDAPQPGKRDLQDRGVHFRVTVRPLGLFLRSRL